uniref:Death domain containing 1 n=1 Tax=Stegastes partitus TaxID=144197 RepID=A0A3B4ZWN8_9TELE
HLSVDEASTVDPALREPGETREQPEDNQVNGHERLEQEVEDGGDQSRTRSLQDTEQIQESSWSHNDVEKTEDEIQVRGQVSDSEDVVAEKDQEKKTDEMKGEWITVGLCGQLEGRSDVPCFIRAPAGDATSLRCEAADDLSCLMVSGSEELVSRVIRVKARDGAACRFPVAVAVPFHARYRGGYRDVAVKIVDEERRVSYITPVTTEGLYGGQRGSFAEVKVYSLGLFAVVSCLKRENYTVLRRGLSLKLPMDPRICLNYLPGSFTNSRVLFLLQIQPLDAVLLASVKSRNDAYRAVVSTSPVLYLTHPTSQPLRRPLTVTLPCPPNPDKKKDTRGQTEEHQPVTASPTHGVFNVRILGASVKSKEMSNESLVVLGSRDKQWNVLDDVIVRNQQNGLVSFDLTENFDRLLVVRLISPLQPCHLASLAEQLEESVCCHAVTVVLQRREDEPHAVLVAALPSRDLGWELNRLRARGCRGFTETSPEISMCEADQLLLRFSGNITSTGRPRVAYQNKRITFHSQRKNQLLVRLTEVDPFGNYSSPHYKGTAIFYKVTKGQLEWRGDEAVLKETKLLGEPVCKLSLTLPKVQQRSQTSHFMVTTREHPVVTDLLHSLPDSLLLWLSGELSEEELSLLALSLRLRRSTAQLVKLRAGDSPSSRAFRILATWRRGLPAVPHQPKTSQLARCLAKSGRPDLARELLLRQAAATRQGSV